MNEFGNCEFRFILIVVAGIFFLPHLKHYGISRQDTECERDTVTFNSNFIEFMLAFLGVDQSECSCEHPCPSVGKFVRLFIYRTYVRQNRAIFLSIFMNILCK